MKNTNENEIWRNVSELGVIEYGGKLVDMSVYDNYEISSYGRVKSLNFHRSGKECILKPSSDNQNYLRIDLYYNGKEQLFRIHKLVALMYLDNPKNLPQINHKDENRSNNHVENLEFCTSQYNNTYGGHIQRMIETRKTSKKWKEGHKRRSKKESKKVYQYDLNMNLIKIWESTMETTRNGFSQGNIASCCRGERKTHKGFIWSYIPLRKTAVRMGYFGVFSIEGWKIKKGA